MHSHICSPKMFFFVCVLLSAPTARAGVPNSFTYQGSLKQNGQPVNGVHSIELRLTNTDGSQIYWTSGPQTVEVKEGLYKMEIAPTGVAWASVTPYIETKVNGVLYLPREMVTSTLYANLAKEVVDGAITSSKLAPDSVTNTVIKDVSAAKITGQFTSAQIGDGQVTNAKIASMDTSKLTGTSLAMNTINALSSLKFAGFETLKILQVQVFKSATAFSTPNTSFTPTPLSGVFTPKTTTSKVLVLASGHFAVNGSVVGYASLFRNNTNLASSNGGLAFTQGHTETTMIAYDAPATNSPVTYSVQIRTNNGLAHVFFPTTDGGIWTSDATMIVIELAQ